MPLSPVLDLVKERLPFIPASALNAVVGSYEIQQYFFLQSFTEIPDVDVENPAQYTGLLRMLVAELISYNFLIREVVKNTGGEAGAAPTASTVVIEGEAGPVKGKFEVIKASDGNALLMQAKNLLPVIKEQICIYAITLEFTDFPYCEDEVSDVIPAFLAFVPDDH